MIYGSIEYLSTTITWFNNNKYTYMGKKKESLLTQTIRKFIINAGKILSKPKRRMRQKCFIKEAPHDTACRGFPERTNQAQYPHKAHLN